MTIQHLLKGDTKHIVMVTDNYKVTHDIEYMLIKGGNGILKQHSQVKGGVKKVIETNLKLSMQSRNGKKKQETPTRKRKEQQEDQHMPPTSFTPDPKRRYRRAKESMLFHSTGSTEEEEGEDDEEEGDDPIPRRGRKKKIKYVFTLIRVAEGAQGAAQVTAENEEVLNQQPHCVMVFIDEGKQNTKDMCFPIEWTNTMLKAIGMEKSARANALKVFVPWNSKIPGKRTPLKVTQKAPVYRHQLYNQLKKYNYTKGIAIYNEKGQRKEKAFTTMATKIHHLMAKHRANTQQEYGIFNNFLAGYFQPKMKTHTPYEPPNLPRNATNAQKVTYDKACQYFHYVVGIQESEFEC